MKMPFGKHAGVSIRYLRDAYLLWLADNERVESRNPELVEAARDELKRRMFGGEIIMPFGVYQGQRFWELPESFLHWMERRMDQQWLRAAAAAELATRAVEARGEPGKDDGIPNCDDWILPRFRKR